MFACSYLSKHLQIILKACRLLWVFVCYAYLAWTDLWYLSFSILATFIFIYVVMMDFYNFIVMRMEKKYSI